MHRGFFITFEGLDGSGKTTQIRRLQAWLTQQGRTVLSLRQPGGTALGDGIRKLLLDSRAESALGTIAPMAELTLMFADRAQAIAEAIEPALASGTIILCDRFTDSSEAYQGGGRELGSERVLALHEAVCGRLQPDLTLLLLPDLAASLLRARGRNSRHLQQHGTDENRFERESTEFYQRVYAAYERIARRELQRVVVVREDSSIVAVEKLIQAIVAARLNLTSAPEALIPEEMRAQRRGSL
jgi:dTMP kinase